MVSHNFGQLDTARTLMAKTKKALIGPIMAEN